MIGAALPQSGVQIGGLRELLLPPDTARGRGEGLVPSIANSHWRGRAWPSGGAGAASRKASRPAEGRRAHTAGGPVPGAQAAWVGGELRGQRKRKQLPPVTLALEPVTKDPVTKNSSPQTVASFLQASHDLLGNE